MFVLLPVRYAERGSAMIATPPTATALPSPSRPPVSVVEESLASRVRSQVACVRTLIDEVERLRATVKSELESEPGVDVAGGKAEVRATLTDQLSDELERLEAFLVELENEIIVVRQNAEPTSSNDPSIP